MMMAAGLLAASSCTDYADYNEAPVDDMAQANKTLWENISQNPNLTDFKALVERTGFNNQLAQSRAYTIWAPKNGTFNVADYTSMSDSLLLAQFVKNHIAEFTYRASGNVDNTRVHTLNNKSYVFNGNGNYTFGSTEMDPTASNIPGTNGILHVINKPVAFYPNLYEYLGLAKGQELDSIVNYFKKYETTYLDLENSEKGPMVNGVQTYVDSMMVTTNSLVRNLRAEIDDEDSTYTFIMPNNEAYKKMYDKVKESYAFYSGVVVQDVEKLTSAGPATDAGDKTRNNTNKTAPTINVNYYKDSLARRAIVRNLIFSHSNAYNQFIATREPQAGDSLFSTTGSLLSNPAELIQNHLVGSPIEMSNGYGRIVDSLAFLPWETYCPERIYTPMGNLGNSFTSKTTNVTVRNSILAEELNGPGSTEFRYRLISPSGERTKPDVFLKLPNLQSTKYNVYCVMLPSSCGAEYVTSTAWEGDTLITSTASFVAPDSLFNGTLKNRLPNAVAQHNNFYMYVQSVAGATLSCNVGYQASAGAEVTNLDYTLYNVGGGRYALHFKLEDQSIATAIQKQGLTISGDNIRLRAIQYDNARTTPLNFDLSYCTTKGALANYHFSAKYMSTQAKGDENPKTFDLNNTAFKADPNKIDTLYLGQVEIPVNYNGLGEDYYPSLYISCPVAVFTAAQMAQYSREFRIYAIIMRPVEKDQYEANNQ